MRIEMSDAEGVPLNTRTRAHSIMSRVASADKTFTFADLVVAAEQWADLSIDSRKVLKAHIRTCAFIAASARARVGGRINGVRRQDVSLESVPCDIPWLNNHLFKYPACTYDLSERGYTNSVTGLRRILRRLDLLAPCETPPDLDGRWLESLRALEGQKFCQIALRRFAAWCQERGIKPEAVCQDCLTRYEVDVRQCELRADIHRVVCGIAKAWRKAARVLPTWPQTPLTPQARPGRYTLPLSAFPVSFKGDVDSLATRLSGEGRRGPFRGDGPPRALRPSSIKTRLYCLRQAASALVLLGRDPLTITGLRDLVDEAAFESILQFFWERARGTSLQQAMRLSENPCVSAWKKDPC